MARYESEFTLFMQDYKKDHPQTEAAQREGRERLWDKPQNAQLAREFSAVELKNQD